MSGGENTSPQPAYQGRHLPRGTRMLRIRTTRRAVQQGQPERPLTHESIPHEQQHKHVCAECFGPRSGYRRGLFCFQCERALFGDGSDGYQAFVRSERARQRERAKRS